MQSTLKNNVRIIGNLGMNPEIKTFGNDQKMARFSVATTETYKNNKGEKVQDTQWHNVVLWGRLAGIAEKYLAKGTQVAMAGKLTNRSYTDKNGNKKFITEINVSEMQILTRKTA